MPSTTITHDDAGKAAVDVTGETVGVIADVRGETADLDPDPGAADRVKTMLGQETVEEEEEDYPLDAEIIDDVTDDEVRLQRAM